MSELKIIAMIFIITCLILNVLLFIEWNVYRTKEYKRFKKHLKALEEKQSFDIETEKKLYALEIIKTKEVDIPLFNACPDYEYNNWVGDEAQLTKEEYDLLREVLENE